MNDTINRTDTGSHSFLEQEEITDHSERKHRDPSKKSCMSVQKRNRAPRYRPDLKLAESYIPGVIVWTKGMLYAMLSVLGAQLLSGGTKHTNKNSPFLFLLRHFHSFYCTMTT
jgi:hypothetical protein